MHIIILILLSMLSTVANGQKLSLHMCREKALENNKEVQAAKVRCEQAEYEITSYRSHFLPRIELFAMDMYSTGKGTLTIDGGHLPIYTLNTETGALLPSVIMNADGSYTLSQYADFPSQNMDFKIKNVFIGGLSVTEPLYTGGKITTAYNMSKLGREMTLLNIQMTEDQVKINTDEAYALVIKAKEMKSVAISYKALLDELLKNVESAVRHGLKTRNDMMKVRVKINEAELGIQKADNAIRLAKMNLCHIIGMPLTTDIDVDENTFADTLCNDLNPLFDAGDISTRPEYSLVDRQTRLSEMGIKLTRSDYLPNVMLMGGIDYNNGLELSGRKLLDGTSASIAIGVKIPLVNFGESAGKLRSAKAKHRISRLEQEDANEKMMLELSQSANNLSEAITEVDITAKALEQAEENMKMSKRQYEVGYEPLSDYLEAQAMWQQAYANKVDARCQLIIAHTKYLKASGKL